MHVCDSNEIKKFIESAKKSTYRSSATIFKTPAGKFRLIWDDPGATRIVSTVVEFNTKDELDNWIELNGIANRVETSKYILSQKDL